MDTGLEHLMISFHHCLYIFSAISLATSTYYRFVNTMGAVTGTECYRH